MDRRLGRICPKRLLGLAIANKSIANSQDNITAGTYTAQSYGETETTLVRFVRLYQGAFVAGVDVVLVGIMAILAWSLLRARKAQQEAQAASSAKTAFLSRMSHDIRTPLNGIIGMLSVNEAHAEDAEYVSQDRKKARVAADHLLSLINDVLDMSKIEDGKVVLEHKPFSIIDAIDEVLVIGRLRAPEFGVTIESIGVKDLVHTDVIGSPDHVRRARHPQVRKGRCGVGADFRHDGERLCRRCPARPRCRHERASHQAHRHGEGQASARHRPPLMLCPFCVRPLPTCCLLRLLVMTFVGILLMFVPFGIAEANPM